MSAVMPFPTSLPKGYEWFDDEPVFDPNVHLQLEAPSETYTLADLGYGSEDIEGKATDFAVSEPFRLLSDEGSRVLLETTRRLRAFHRRAGDRIERVTRGGCFRSRFLRDLCHSPEATAHLAEIYRVPVLPHPMTLHLGHLNFEPEQVGASVDKWHHDTLPLDYVLMVTDPTTLQGGEFEWFRGTKAEAAALAASGQTPPRERVVQPQLPGAGYVIALHGDMVVHRAAGLNAPGERITMVNGYVAADTTTDEQSRCVDLIEVDDPEVLYAEWAKFAAWRSAGRLQSIIEELPFGSSAEDAATALETAIASATVAVTEMRSGLTSPIHSYEQET